MTKQLLTEERRAPVTILESDQDGAFRFQAVVSEADFLNQNRRVYPQEVLFPAFERYNVENSAGTAEPGLVDHPGFLSGVSVSDIGIAWERFHFEGKQVMGVGRIVETQRGLDLKTAMKAGIPVGFSTRGYGIGEEIEAADGRPATRMVEFDLATVDAVVTPSVKHARVLSFTKEETEQMEKELREAQEALQAALARVAELEASAATNASEHEAVVAERDELLAALETANARVAELEAVAAEFGALKAEAELAAKLNELTEGHRFAATIISEARELGVTLESAEKVVSRLKTLVEAAGAAANEAAPRGELSSQEDGDGSEPTVSIAYTAEQLDELRGSNLISESEYREYLAQLG